jgi:Na+-translocating ferredoxin:NAD+ oxidoreductase RNF subunit RnfB
MKQIIGTGNGFYSNRKIREIYEILPKLNCGLCGFRACAQFARAVAEGRASPFGCRQDNRSGYTISKIVGVKVPSTWDLKALKKEVKRFSQELNCFLSRIEKLRRDYE